MKEWLKVKEDTTVTQEMLNLNIAKLVVDKMLAFSFVDSEEWKFFMQNCMPGKKNISRSKLMLIITEQYKIQHLALKKCLVADVIKCVATTADCWTGAHR